MSATRSAHHPNENTPSLRASSWWPEKSNAWSLEDREDVYRRRTDGERWESICLDYPNRSKHAMQQQYSIMKKQNLSITPAKGSVRRRKQLEPMQAAVLDIPSNEEPAQDGGQDFPVSISSKYDSDDTDYEGSRASLDSDRITQQSDKPRTRSTPKKVRGTPQAAMKEQTPSESDDEPKEPVSERPRRAGAGHINYNLLANAADLDSEVRSVKIFKKRREKGKPGSGLKAKRNHFKSDGVRLKKSRKTPSIDKSAKTPADMTTNGAQVKLASKSPKASNDVFEPKNEVGNSKPALSNAQELLVRSPKKRRRRIDAHLDGDPIEGQFDFQLGDPVKPKKRRHAQENVPQDLPLRQAVDLLSPDIFNEETECPDQRTEKPKKHSSDEMLPTKEPKSKTKFGKRRGRPPVLARSASEAISRRPRGTQYQFPYLPGYVGPPPPDLATILARQDEMERQNGPRSSTPPTATTEGSFAAATEDSVEKESPGLKWEGEIPAESGSRPLEYQKANRPSEELDKAREEGRRMQAAQDAEKRDQRDYILKEAQQRIAYLEKQRREVEKERHEVHKEHEKSLKALRQGNKAKMDGLRSRHLIEMESQRAKHIEEMKALRGQLPPPSPPPPTVTGTSIFHANPALEPPMHPPPVPYPTFGPPGPLPPPPLASPSPPPFRGNPALGPSIGPPPSAPSPPPPFPYLPTPSPATSSSKGNNNYNNNSNNNKELRPLVIELRDQHIRMAGKLRDLNEDNKQLNNCVERFVKGLDEGDVSMRGVRTYVGEIRKAESKIGEVLVGAREASDGVKGTVMRLLSRVEQ